ncbi:hypothetical protein [Streptomyces sp. BRA346]
MLLVVGVLHAVQVRFGRAIAFRIEDDVVMVRSIPVRPGGPTGV